MPKEIPTEREAGFNEVADKNIAREAAYSEKPFRDAMRDNNLNLTEQEKTILGSVADRAGEKTIKKIEHEYDKRSSLRFLISPEDRRGVGYRRSFVRSEAEIGELEWQALLEITKGSDIEQLIIDLHASKNQPLSINKYPVIGRSPNLKFSSLNTFFDRSNLLYRLGAMEHSGKYSDAKTFKLFIVSL